MKKTIDNFSKQAAAYKKYRPTYPKDLYSDILQHVQKRDKCWDCGTGNGQVAIVLSEHFETVYASDIIQKQLNNAGSRSNIIYSQQRAEATDFKNHQFDLVTVGQAVHWFDFEAFNREVRRVSKSGGIVSIWGYGLIKIEPGVDKIIEGFYKDIVGPYWDKERKHVDDRYASIPFDFDEIEAPVDKCIRATWTLEEFEGYINTWSSVQNYLIKNGGKNPVCELIEQLKKNWDGQKTKEVRFPIFMRMGRI